jgi:arylsulfatase A-like enzyme
MDVTRRTFLAGLSTAAASAWAPRRKPNLIWIMADDLGLGDLGCYGQKQIRTPNIDRLAAQGMQFDAAYAGCTVCAPSRSVLMTGLHTGHTPVRANSGGVPLLDSDVTVAELLRKAGYRTGLFGKWGLGDIGTGGAPERQGFDEYCGYLHQVHAHWFYPEFIYRNGKRLPLEGNTGGQRTTYSHDVIARHGLEFLETSRDKPFFAYFPFTIPHLELLAPEESVRPYRGKFPEWSYVDKNRHYADQPNVRAVYAGMISRLDRDVGRIAATLRRLNRERDTLLFFTSDNGAALRIWGEDYFRSTAGLRGHKQNLYEGGIRTPLLARWPGRIRPGSRTSHLFSFQDFLPTALDAAGETPPAGIDGISALPTLLGSGRQPPHDYLYWELPRYDRKHNDFFAEVPMQALRKGDWKVVRPKPDGPLELYNLKDDPMETKDLSSTQVELMSGMRNLLTAARTAPRPQKEEDSDGWWSK